MSRRDAEEAIVAPRPTSLVAGALLAVAAGGCLASKPVHGKHLPRGRAVTIIGDFICPESVEQLNAVGMRFDKVYSVTGRKDDPYIVGLLADRGMVIDGRIVEVGEGLYVAGIGGREPLMNIARLLESLTLLPKGSLVTLASYHAPHGVLDRSRLGVHVGLLEVRSLVKSLVESGLRVIVLSSHCSPPGAIVHYNHTIVVCLYRLVDANKCFHMIELDGSVKPLCTEEGARA